MEEVYQTMPETQCLEDGEIVSSFNIHTLTVKVAHIKEPNKHLLCSNKIPNSKSEIWTHLWGSGFALAEIIARLRSENIFSKQILEVGCGAGVASLVGAICHASVTMSDTCDDALKLCLKSVHLNNIPNNVKTWRLNWDTPVTESSHINKFNVLMGADVLYMRNSIKPLCRLLNECLEPINGTAIFVDPGRCYTDDFVSECSSNGWYVLEQHLEFVQTAVCTLRKCIIIIVQRNNNEFSMKLRDSITSAIEELTINPDATNLGFNLNCN